MSKVKDITGKRFGKLTAIKYTGNIDSHGCVWLCKCDCGKYIEASTGNLVRGYPTACKDCTEKNRRERIKIAQSRRREKLYAVWKGMRQRCRNSNSKAYHFYGKRGINVCQEWDIYTNFRNWALANGYKEGLSIERINVDGDYCPQNCTWINFSSQAYNTRRTLYIEFKGIKIPLAKMIHDLGLPYKTVVNYLKSLDKSTTNLL